MRVVLPLIKPGIVAGASSPSYRRSANTWCQTSSGGLQGIMFGNLIATAFQSFNWPLGSALSVVLLATIVLVLLTLFRMAEAGRGLFGEEARA